MLTYQQASLVHRSIAEDVTDGGAVIYPHLRRLIADRLAERWPADEGMGTSDISIAITESLRVFEVPHIGPIIKAYEACGFTMPASIAYPDAFQE